MYTEASTHSLSLFTVSESLTISDLTTDSIIRLVAKQGWSARAVGAPTLKNKNPINLTIYGDSYGDMTNSVFSQFTLSQVAANRSQPEIESPRSAAIDSAWFVLPIALCGAIAWSAITKIVDTRKTKAKEQESSVCLATRQIPCQQCRYFSANGYLNCAIRPSQVLTQEAIECSDYDPQEQKV